MFHTVNSCLFYHNLPTALLFQLQLLNSLSVYVAAGVSFSDVSLMKQNKKSKRASASFPVIKPDLSAAEV